MWERGRGGRGIVGKRMTVLVWEGPRTEIGGMCVKLEGDQNERQMSRVWERGLEITIMRALVRRWEE